MIKIGYCLFGSFLILGEQMAPLSSHEAERWYGEKNQKKPYALKKKVLLKRLPSTLASFWFLMLFLAVPRLRPYGKNSLHANE